MDVYKLALGILLIIIGFFLLISEVLALFPPLAPFTMAIRAIKYKGPASIGLIIFGIIFNSMGI